MNKLMSTYRHLFAIVTICTVSVSKCNKNIFYFHYTMVADCNAIRIATEIVKNFCRVVEMFGEKTIFTTINRGETLSLRAYGVTVLYFLDLSFGLITSIVFSNTGRGFAFTLGLS